MAATKIDALLTQITDLIKEAQLEEGEHSLDLEEAADLCEVGEIISEIHNEYMDRMISLAADAVRNPHELVFQADADMDEMDRARERVRLRLMERGIPMMPVDKTKLN
jgi:hypothetical protein